MTRVFASVIAAAFALPAFAQDANLTSEALSDEALSEVAQDSEILVPLDAGDVTLAEFQWVARPIIIFADTPADPRFQEQLALLADRPVPLLERDVVIITDTDPSARSDLRRELRPRGFALVVMTKDGAVGMRRPSPRDVREITRGIDNFALRQEELRSGN